MIKNFLKEYQSYRRIGEKALAQVPDEALNRVIGADNNSVAVIVRHISGNLRSRFTDFLTSDGEKPWRDRDAEFADLTYDRQAVEQMLAEGFQVVENELTAGASDGRGDHMAVGVEQRGQRLGHRHAGRCGAHTAHQRNPGDHLDVVGDLAIAGDLHALRHRMDSGGRHGERVETLSQTGKAEPTVGAGGRAGDP